MNSLLKPISRAASIAGLCGAMACAGTGIEDSENAVIDPPGECSSGLPDCSISNDFPTEGELTPENSSGLRFSDERGGLVIDRIRSLDDEDLDGVPDDADECLGQPGFRAPCDGSDANDGIFRTLFYSPDNDDARRNVTVPATADLPVVDIYFLVDASTSMRSEILEFQTNLPTIISDVEALFDDVRFGLGIVREYPLPGLAAAESQAPYHHVVDLTADTGLFTKGVDSLNLLGRISDESALTQALHAVATGEGLATFVPNRVGCPAGETGYPCFREEALRVVFTLTNSEVANGPRGAVDYTFALEPGSDLRPPVQMFPALLDADDEATALDLGDLSAGSLTLMGMTTNFTNAVSTNMAAGCDANALPPFMSLDTEDAVVTFRFDAPSITSASALSDYTHFSSNLALFDTLPIDPMNVIVCNGGDLDMMPPTDPMFWGRLAWTPVTSQQYYLVIDGKTSGMDPAEEQRGPFQLEISHSDDVGPNPAWLTADAPVTWTAVETALLAEDVRVASVVSAKAGGNDGELDAREIASATGAETRIGEPWVGTAGQLGEGLDAAIVNALRLAAEESGYDIRMTAIDNDATIEDETLFIRADGLACMPDPACDAPVANQCTECLAGTLLGYELRLLNDFIADTDTPQVFDFELVVDVDDKRELERIPVRVLVPDSASHEFDATPEMNFYRNTYDPLDRCNIPPERPSWGNLVWTGSTPGDSTIEFQIRTADTEAELDTVTPASIIVPTDTSEDTIDIGSELIAAGLSDGLLYLRVTAMLNPSPDFLSTPELTGWTLEFSCFPAD